MSFLTKLPKQILAGHPVLPAFFALFVGILLMNSNVFVRASTAPSPLPIQREEVMQAEGVTPSIDAAALESVVAMAREHPQKLPPLSPEKLDEETLWLARCIYSETKRPEEMELVAWVVRNRVETRYRGESTYKDVVLDPYQFSAFNPGSRKRKHYSSLTPNVKLPGWQHALNIAYHVRYAEPGLRPFPTKTRHFYSERSMPRYNAHPGWSRGLEPVTPRRPVELDARRFRFFEGVS